MNTFKIGDVCTIEGLRGDEAVHNGAKVTLMLPYADPVGFWLTDYPCPHGNPLGAIVSEQNLLEADPEPGESAQEICECLIKRLAVRVAA